MDVFGKCGEVQLITVLSVHYSAVNVWLYCDVTVQVQVQTVRMSKKNFCHIRYSHEYCVDNAVYLSGWR